MEIVRNGIKYELTNKELEQAYYEQQRKFDTENLIKRINEQIFYEELPPLDDETKLKMAEYALEEYRYNLDNNQDITEIMEDIGRESIMMYVDKLPVVCTYPICNTGSVNIYFINEEYAFAGINQFNPARYDLECDESGNFYFEIGDLKISVSEVM